MIRLKHRSEKKELLDAPNVPFEHIKKNMQELNTINTLLGGHAISLSGFKKFLPAQKLIICEIGCGGGDNLHVLDKFCKENNIDASFIGIDIQEACLSFAKEQYPEMNCDWVCADYSQAAFNQQPDIIFSSLFCHHFSNDQIVSMLQWMQHNATKGFFINDLERNVFAYYSIKWLTQIFSHSFMVKNDAPLSVARGFTKNEWSNLLQKAKIKTATIQWKWAFRHLILFKK